MCWRVGVAGERSIGEKEKYVILQSVKNLKKKFFNQLKKSLEYVLNYLKKYI